MICFNITDVETPALKKAGMVNRTIMIGAAIIQPGESVELADTPMNRQLLVHAVASGYVAVDRLPPMYGMTKSRLQQGRRMKIPVVVTKPKRPRIRTSKRK